MMIMRRRDKGCRLHVLLGSLATTFAYVLVAGRATLENDESECGRAAQRPHQIAACFKQADLSKSFYGPICLPSNRHLREQRCEKVLLRRPM